MTYEAYQEFHPLVDEFKEAIRTDPSYCIELAAEGSRLIALRERAAERAKEQDFSDAS